MLFTSKLLIHKMEFFELPSSLIARCQVMLLTIVVGHQNVPIITG